MAENENTLTEEEYYLANLGNSNFKSYKEYLESLKEAEQIMGKRTLSKEEMAVYLEEIRDNTPEIYEAEDKIYYNLLTEIIENINMIIGRSEK